MTLFIGDYLGLDLGGSLFGRSGIIGSGNIRRLTGGLRVTGSGVVVCVILLSRRERENEDSGKDYCQNLFHLISLLIDLYIIV